MATTKVTHDTNVSYTRVDRRRIMAAASLGWGLEFFDLQLVSLLATPIMDSFGITRGQIGAIFTAQLIATALGGIVFGRLADIYGRKRVLSWTIWVFGLSTVLSAFAPTFWVFLLLRVVTGFGTGGEWAVGFSLLNEAWTPKRRGLAGGAVQSSLWFGYAAAILVTSIFAGENWRWAFVMGGLPVLAAIWVRRRCPESKQWLAMRAGVESGAIPEQGNGLTMLARPQWLRIVVLATLVVMGGQYSYYVYSSWMPTYLKEELGVSATDANTILYVSAGIALVSYLASGGLSDKIGRRSSLVSFAIIQLIGFGLFTYFNANDSSVSLTVFSYFVISFGLGYFGIFGAWLGELFPTAIRASGASFSYSVGRGIASTGPLIVGILAANYGLAGGISTGAIAIVVMIVFSFFLKDQKGREITAVH
ncbi:MFS transporter [Rhodococcus sp. NBC_00294]|uniref:MFS transporter n=1 Tax=Rhodococcus sp. NBC_00294 TaxID=2976004 RepID=UPI002E2C7C7C|nr:MFS transporter [Rhodococcus sp. NBC_00294]